MDNFFTGLRRHRISRVAAAYTVAGWFLIQLVNNLAPLMRPEAGQSVLRIVVVLVVTGFPIALVAAWALGPRSGEASSDAVPPVIIDLVLIAAVVSVAALMVWQQFVPTPPDLFSRLGVRNVARLTALSIIVAWVLHQSVGKIAPVLKLPRWTARAVLLSLVVGFPIAAFFGWMQLLDASIVLRAAATPSQVIDIGLGGALLCVTALAVHQHLIPALRTATQQNATALAQPSVPSQLQALPSTSVAVLPFLNLSRDAGEEYFSDGMTVEITSALANVPGLLVIGRVSAFKFKGHSQDLRSIGLELGTTHLIEGSVRKLGNRVRITAELIQASNGGCVWAESFDRELTDIFAVQEEIARAIASAMHVPLGLKQSAVRNRTKDFDSYENYLRAKALIRARGLANLTKASDLLEQVVAQDPGFAPESLIAEIRRNARYLQDDYADLALTELVDAGAIARRLRAALESAEGFVRAMPAGKEGLLFLKDGETTQADPAKLSDYTEHAGSRRGHWPSSSEIGGAMLDRIR